MFIPPNYLPAASARIRRTRSMVRLPRTDIYLFVAISELGLGTRECRAIVLIELAIEGTSRWPLGAGIGSASHILDQPREICSQRSGLPAIDQRPIIEYWWEAISTSCRASEPNLPFRAMKDPCMDNDVTNFRVVIQPVTLI